MKNNDSGAWGGSELPDFFEGLLNFGERCPKCGELLEKKGDLYLCHTCKKALTREDLK